MWLCGRVGVVVIVLWFEEAGDNETRGYLSTSPCPYRGDDQHHNHKLSSLWNQPDFR